MYVCNKQLLAASVLALMSAFSTTSIYADPTDIDFSNDGHSQFVEENALGTPLGLVDLNVSGTRTVDGTGLRAISNPSTETVDGTGFRAESAPTTETVDGTGFLRSVGSTPAGTETVDGTGLLRSVPIGNSVDSMQPESTDLGE